MKKKCSAEIRMGANTVLELKNSLIGIPDTARVSVRTDKYHDQRDPGGSWLVFEWTEEF